MVVVHAYVLGPTGNIENVHDFLRNDGSTALTGSDVYIPFDKEYEYPLNEKDTLSILRTMELKREDDIWNQP